MKTSDIVFVGIKGSVVALSRTTGQQLWMTQLKSSSFVNVVVQNDRVLASCYGEVFCLDPLTGNLLWHNRLTGFGMGLATLAMVNTSENANAAVLAAKRQQDEESSRSAAMTPPVIM